MCFLFERHITEPKTHNPHPRPSLVFADKRSDDTAVAQNVPYRTRRWHDLFSPKGPGSSWRCPLPPETILWKYFHLQDHPQEVPGPYGFISDPNVYSYSSPIDGLGLNRGLLQSAWQFGVRMTPLWPLQRYQLHVVPKSTPCCLNFAHFLDEG